MKTLKHLVLLSGLAGGLFTATVALSADAPDTAPPAPPADATQTNATTDMPQPAAAADQTPQPPPEAATPPASGTNSTAAPAPAQVPSTVMLPNGEKGFIMNFRGVPLEQVLNFLSTEAGFIIQPSVSLRGNVDVWSNQPLSRDEAVKLLQQVLIKRSYGVIRTGNVLEIVTADEARKRNIPVIVSNEPTNIPNDSVIVTQIIPVRSLNAIQLIKDLGPLLNSDNVIANDAGNSLIMTDTQANIRHITEIIRALDSVSASINTIKVYSLKYADAKSLVTTVTALFPDTSTAAGGRNPFGRTRGGGGGGLFGGGFNPFGGGGGQGGNSADSGHTPNTRVSATSDDHSNSLIVSAPDDLIPTIDDLIKAVDTSVEDLTQLKVFHLKNADPTEMANLITAAYPDPSSSSGASGQAAQFAGGFRGIFGGLGGRGGNANQATGPSDRMKLLGHVVAVPDQRTASVVVTAANDVMPGIEQMIEELDNNDAQKQTLAVIPLINADPLVVQQVLQGIFTSTTSSRPGSQNSSTSTDALTSRQTQAIQSSGSSSSAFGGSAFGSGGAGGSRSSVP